MVRPIIKLSFFMVTTLFLMQGCYYDNEQELYPNTGTCDTTAVTYSAKITPIMQNNCYTCHSNASSASSGGGISLEGHTNLSGYITTNQQLFLDAIKHTGTASPMPKNGGSLTPCQITQIQVWINAGKPNN